MLLVNLWPQTLNLKTLHPEPHIVYIFVRLGMVSGFVLADVMRLMYSVGIALLFVASNVFIVSEPFTSILCSFTAGGPQGNKEP